MQSFNGLYPYIRVVRETEKWRQASSRAFLKILDLGKSILYIIGNWSHG
jgi:hypothetical protein